MLRDYSSVYSIEYGLQRLAVGGKVILGLSCSGCLQKPHQISKNCADCEVFGEDITAQDYSSSKPRIEDLLSNADDSFDDLRVHEPQLLDVFGEDEEDARDRSSSQQVNVDELLGTFVASNNTSNHGVDGAVESYIHQLERRFEDLLDSKDHVSGSPDGKHLTPTKRLPTRHVRWNSIQRMMIAPSYEEDVTRTLRSDESSASDAATSVRATVLES